VLIGRPVIYSLAVNGEEGVSQMLDILRREIDNTMAQLGAANLRQLTPAHVVMPKL